MESKTIKVNEENYKWLLRKAADLQKKSGRPVSFDDALNEIRIARPKTIISDLAGSWRMSDSEWKEIKEKTKKGWSKWKISYV